MAPPIAVPGIRKFNVSRIVWPGGLVMFRTVSQVSRLTHDPLASQLILRMGYIERIFSIYRRPPFAPPFRLSRYGVC